jgi:hypothetical protein
MLRFSVWRDWCPEENVFDDPSDDFDTETSVLLQEPHDQLADIGNRAVPDVSREIVIQSRHLNQYSPLAPLQRGQEESSKRKIPTIILFLIDLSPTFS